MLPIADVADGLADAVVNAVADGGETETLTLVERESRWLQRREVGASERVNHEVVGDVFPV